MFWRMGVPDVERERSVSVRVEARWVGFLVCVDIIWVKAWDGVVRWESSNADIRWIINDVMEMESMVFRCS